LDQETLKELGAVGVVSSECEYVLDGKSRELIYSRSVSRYDDGSVYDVVSEFFYDGETPDGLKKFLEYDQQTENLRTITVVSNPGATNEKSQSVQVPKGLIVTLEPDLGTDKTFTMYSDAVFQTLYIAVRLLLMVMITTTLTATTKPLDMTLGIEDLLKPFGKIGVPYHEIAMLISIALRFIPDLIDETQRIIKAQESRGVDLKEGKFMERVMAILSLIVPLFVSAFQRAEDLANAMEARGYAPGEERTRYKVLKMEGRDYILLIVCAALLACMIWLSMRS
jgi:energy-coupling factor transporter transmembrane protein EcfT